jgi:DnaK suppressor protein
MNADSIFQLRQILLNTRKDVLERVKDLESRWLEMGERTAEIEEEAQKELITLSYDRLDENGKETIEQIDLALHKILIGEYGICEHCGDDISPQRLEAVPWTRLCIDCAREFERKRIVLPSPTEAVETSEVPDEFEGLSNNQILQIIHDEIERDGKIDPGELNISIRNGVVHLDGNLPGEPERQILLQLLTDVLGFTDIVDHLSVDDVPFERDDASAGRESPPAGPTFENRLLYDEEQFTDDVFDAEGDEVAYSPPDEPPAQPEYRPITG